MNITNIIKNPKVIMISTITLFSVMVFLLPLSASTIDNAWNGSYSSCTGCSECTTVCPTPTPIPTPIPTPTPTPCATPLDKAQFKAALNNGQIIASAINVLNGTDNTAWVTLTNNTNCPAQVSLSSYKMFAEWPNLSTQVFFNGTNLVTVPARTSRVL